MPTLSTAHKLAVGYVLSLVGIVALGFIAYNASKEEIYASDWILHTEQVIASLEEVQRAALDAESAGRSFLISGDSRDLAYYQSLLPIVDIKLKAFWAFTRDNTNQQILVGRLTPLIAQRFNELTARVLLRKNQSIEEMRRSSLASRGRDDMAAVKATVAQMIAEEQRVLKERTEARGRTIHAVWGTIGLMIALVCMLTWISFHLFNALRRIRVAEDQATHLAHHDGLTGLPNRRLLRDRIEQALASAERHQHRVAFLFLDLDGFKKINDSLGHDAGDALLKEVGLRLTSVLRKADTVARIGGDEFVVGLTHINRPKDAELVAQKLVEIVGAPYHLRKRSLTITVSIGISVSPEHGRNIDELMKNSDSALYEAKKQGKNRYCVYFANVVEAS